jgi:voltage-gated potassium channel
MEQNHTEQPTPIWKERLHEIIFKSDTLGGKLFDGVLLVCILLSIVAVMLESVDTIRERYRDELHAAEWAFTALFTIEYALRLAVSRRPARYARSFFGIIDLLAILPTYLAILLPGAQSLMAVRALRLIRVFRIFKMAEYVGESRVLVTALRASRPKIVVFLVAVTTVVVVIGAVMYLVEGPEHGFTSIPTSVYWAIVTMTTVGYGDIAPQTPAGKAIASFIMVLGYGIIAVPTGIVTSELTIARSGRRPETGGRSCTACGVGGHEPEAAFCKRCGAVLRVEP